VCFDRLLRRAFESFEELVGDLDYPMLIVTVAVRDQLGGCLVGFATQTSISPPRFIVCLSERNRTTKIACHAEYLGVHFLPREADQLAELFGGETADDVDKFSGVGWEPGPAGTPLLDDCRNRFVGRILERRPVGDHLAFLLEPILAEHPEPVRPFSYRRAQRIDPGHEA
jgi:flavin reductase (DIM6/NTAB) family NADH-FMN oxidoreductase RutF